MSFLQLAPGGPAKCGGGKRRRCGSAVRDRAVARRIPLQAGELHAGRKWLRPNAVLFKCLHVRGKLAGVGLADASAAKRVHGFLLRAAVLDEIDELRIRSLLHCRR